MMSLVQASHDSLPYIDQEPTANERARAEQLITNQLAPEYQQHIHSLIPPEPSTSFSQFVQTELERKAAGLPIQGGIDLSRYEAPEGPSRNDDDTDSINAWRTALQKAYVSDSYLSGRLINLSLLDDLGRNAWLIGNSQLEDILRDLERELAGLKTATDNVNKARKAAQENSKGEVVNLEETWKRGVGRILEVQVATEGLRQKILERRRQTAK